MLIIDDEESDDLHLPKRYGVDDLPIIIQDRTFDDRGHLVYRPDDAGDDGWYGDTVIINGAIQPYATVPAGKVRLRLLNGANARFYILQFDDGRPFYKIATDGGFLEKPVKLTEMEMGPGERCEIIVDLSDGKPAKLHTLFEDVYETDGPLGGLFQRMFRPELPTPTLSLVPDPGLVGHTDPLPTSLTTIERPKPADIVRTRDFILEMDHGGGSHHAGMHGTHGPVDMTINGAAMDMAVINEEVQAGEWERWRMRAGQGEHPFHIHGCSFLIETLESEPAPAHQRGWKDTVAVDDDGWSEVLVKFDQKADKLHPYMYHCHILEHEDRGMMGQFTVS